MIKRAALLVMLLAAPASANVWDHAVITPAEETAREQYDARLIEGDAATQSSTLVSTSASAKIDAVRRAEAAYRAATLLRPGEAEPYFRIGNLIYQSYFDCDPQLAALCDPIYATPVRADVAINAWNAFEARAPLDPRISDILLRRALLNTKLVNGLATDHGRLEAAARDYRAALDRSDGISTTRGDEQMLGNLAETYMMLDRLDDAIDMYQQAVAAGAARTSTVYGMAVALDRDGQGDQAIRRILGQGEEGFDSFEKEFFRATIFFVPEGESNYYFALANEAFGNDGQALEYWSRYVKSGAHPEFQPRAKEHIEQLSKRGVHAEAPAPFRDSD